MPLKTNLRLLYFLQQPQKGFYSYLYSAEQRCVRDLYSKMYVSAGSTLQCAQSIPAVASLSRLDTKSIRRVCI